MSTTTPKPIEPPTLATERFILRMPQLRDARQVQTLAGDKAIAQTTLSIPHPYPDGVAETWIKQMPERFKQGTHVGLAIAKQDDDKLIGVISLVIQPDHSCAELGYWVGKPYWGKGVATEAAGAMLAYGFNGLKLNRIFAHHMASNPSSGRVMEKLGMKREGCLRQHICKWGEFYDSVCYGLLKAEYDAAQ